MSLKRKITKAEHAALDPKLQAEYKAEGEEFVLDATGFDDPGELRRALDREREDRKLATERADKAEADFKVLKDSSARNSGDIVALENSWKQKLSDKEKELKKVIEGKDGFIKSTLVDAVAQQLASELSGDNAAVILPHIKARLSADFTGDTPATRILDKDGKPSAMTTADLKKEFSENKSFAPIVIASRASGGGAAGGGGRPGTGGGAGAPVVRNGKAFKDLSEQERVDWYKSDPTGFQQAAKVATAPHY